MDNVDYGWAISIVTSVLFILSELIGVSKCKPNGVFEFCMYGMRCTCGRTGEEEVEI